MASGIAQKGRKEPWPKKILNYFKFNELSFFGQPLTTLVNICQPKTFTCESFHDPHSQISFTCERKKNSRKFHTSLLGDSICRTTEVLSIRSHFSGHFRSMPDNAVVRCNHTLYIGSYPCGHRQGSIACERSD